MSLNLLKNKCCAYCQHAIEFGFLHYCNQLGKMFEFEALFWELDCKYFIVIGWPIPINQKWRLLRTPTKRATFVTKQFTQFEHLLKKALR